MHFAIHYRTEYRYEEPVTDNLNVLRVKPATTPTQRVDEFSIRVDPESRLQQHDDYYGTTVIEFGVTKPHERLTIDVRARVSTAQPPDPPAGSWAAVEAPAYAHAAGEYLVAPGPEPEDVRIDELVGEARAATPLDTLRRVVELVPERFEYRPGVTYVGSTVEDLLEGGAGVCQDFAHLTLLLLRRNGLAARYVSGYLFAPPSGDDGDDGADSAEVDTHAWIEALVPSDDGEPMWVAGDPTNRHLPGERHVKIGHGRRYADVPPIRGVYRGGAGSHLEASVQMHRTDAAAARA